MFTSAISFTIANFIIIWLVILNNVGPGWEVPVGVILAIVCTSILLFVTVLIALISFILNIKKFKNSILLFKIAYSVSFLICIISLVYLLAAGGYGGQLWMADFPSVPFLLTTVPINIILFVLIVIGYLRSKSIYKE